MPEALVEEAEKSINRRKGISFERMEFEWKLSDLRFDLGFGISGGLGRKQLKFVDIDCKAIN